jgi:hypothetical protein
LKPELMRNYDRVGEDDLLSATAAYSADADTVRQMPPVFALQFPIQQVPEYAGRYTDDDDEVLAIAQAVRNRGHYTLEEFRRVCRWKTPRSVKGVKTRS